MRAVYELVVGGEADAVPRAGKFTTTSVAGVPVGTVEDAGLVVTELVTNASLHGAPPVTLRLIQQGESLRIEVADAGRAVPVQVRHDVDAMTGRGLSVLAAVASAWGVDPSAAGGKVVWAELRAGATAGGGAVGPEMDVAGLLAAWQDEEPVESRFTVRLGSVPTDLLVAAKARTSTMWCES